MPRKSSARLRTAGHIVTGDETHLKKKLSLLGKSRAVVERVKLVVGEVRSI